MRKPLATVALCGMESSVLITHPVATRASHAICILRGRDQTAVKSSVEPKVPYGCRDIVNAILLPLPGKYWLGGPRRVRQTMGRFVLIG